MSWQLPNAPSSLPLVSWLLHTLFPPQDIALPAGVPPRLSSTPRAWPPRGLLPAEPDPWAPVLSGRSRCPAMYVSSMQVGLLSAVAVSGVGLNQENLLNDAKLERRNIWQGGVRGVSLVIMGMQTKSHKADNLSFKT